jgi:hypothetical protein
MRVSAWPSTGAIRSGEAPAWRSQASIESLVRELAALGDKRRVKVA